MDHFYIKGYLSGTSAVQNFDNLTKKTCKKRIRHQSTTTTTAAINYSNISNICGINSNNSINGIKKGKL